MSQDYVADLLKLAPSFQPVGRPGEGDWRLAEQELGVRLPSDYKYFLNAFGQGGFGAGLMFRNPAMSNEHLGLSKKVLLEYRDMLRFLEERMGIFFYPHPEGLLKVGDMDRTQFYYRPAAGGDGLWDFVCLDHDDEEVRELNMPIAQYLHHLYLGYLQDSWSAEFREAVWRDQTLPLFSPHRKLGGL